MPISSLTKAKSEVAGIKSRRRAGRSSMETFLIIVFFITILISALLWKASREKPPGRSSKTARKPPFSGVNVLSPVMPAPDVVLCPIPKGRIAKGR